MSVEIRIASRKRPSITAKSHRVFTEFERELNLMTRKQMYKEWTLKLDPYKMKAIVEFDDGRSNPFHLMSIYQIREFVKTAEQREDFPLKKENNCISFGIEMVVNYKDLWSLTTSEAVACYLLFHDGLTAWRGKEHREPSDQELAHIAYMAVMVFMEDWETAMAGLKNVRAM